MSYWSESLIERHPVVRLGGLSVLQTMLLIGQIHRVTFHWRDEGTLAVLFHFSRNEVLQVLLHYDLRRVALITPKLELLAVDRRCLRKPRSRLFVVEVLEPAHVLLVCLGYGVVAVL